MRQLKINLPACDGGNDCEHECEQACANKVFKLEDLHEAALHIQEGPDGASAAILCDQCGDCVIVCPADALKRNKSGVVMIDKHLCVGCYMCIGFCEKGAFQRHQGWLEPYKCTACGICVRACPHAALEIVDVPVPAPRII
jgi:Fe-S-cluster-containing hydrogenase component 2